MSNESPLSFDDLVDYRQQLQRFCSGHYPSLIAFQDGASFKLNLDEESLQGPVRHLSSTATCIESLLECPEVFRPKKSDDILKIAKAFATSAIRRAHDKWISDGSARIYCRCRTLPFVVRHLPEYRQAIQEHLDRILGQLKRDVSRLAVGEASDHEPSLENWYPPNAFHTYWTLNLLSTIEERFPVDFAKMCATYKKTRLNMQRLRVEMLAWAKKTAGYQIALHASESSTLDSDQLAWSLTTIVNFDRDFQAGLAQQDFIRYGFKCLFDHQTRTGNWRTGAPLFHYLKSGNAYCYVFETFTALLKSAMTERRGGTFLRQVLRPYARHLLELWNYAITTQIPLLEDGRALGWSSGHRANHNEAESWATASVYAFSQCLRRLVGIWTREAAADQLRVSRAIRSEDEALRDLAERGQTWATENGETAANQLMALFVNPARMYGAGNDLEPDSQPIQENQARAAILFGPPGTSKTTLSRSVADAVGWDYVELHASHFVADGLPNVQRTADMIFEKLMQLDRTVILFDEIDELVRAREKEPDAFGRFLTTSMLPKLAELWKRRKVIYFIATNHIRFFDPAVTRAQRFDALVHVAPPSFERKLNQVEKLLAANFNRVVVEGLTSRDIERALESAIELEPIVALPERNSLAKFLLMRWDQLQELVSIISSRGAGGKTITVNQDVLQNALVHLSDPSLKTCGPFREYSESGKYEQHDFSKIVVWEVTADLASECKDKLTATPGHYWYISRRDFADFTDLPGECRISAPGLVGRKE